MLPAPPALTPDQGAILLTGSAGTSYAAGVSREHHVSPDDFASCFQTLRTFSLDVRLDGPDLADTLSALLTAWRASLAGIDPWEIETSATITWPSRDVAAVETLVRYGFAPMADIAVRGRVVPLSAEVTPGTQIREAGPSDVEDVVDLQLEELRYDAQLGTCTIRPGTAAALRTRLTSALDRRDGTILLADHNDEPVGLVIIDLPPRTEWITSRVGVSRAGYLECLSVRAGHRGRGIGRALVAVAHERFRDAAVDVMLLHHAVTSPLSAPFWHAAGYRPLWTHWTAHPGTSMFTAPH